MRSTANRSGHLAELGIPVYYERPGRLDEIPTSLLHLGRFAGTEARAAEAVRQFTALRGEIVRAKRRP